MGALTFSITHTHARTPAHAVWVIMHVLFGTPQRDLGNMSSIFESMQCSLPRKRKLTFLFVFALVVT